MYKKRKRVLKINLFNEESLLEYEKLLNNPNCCIIEEKRAKEVIKEFHGEGEGTSTTTEYLILIYEETSLL